MQKKTTKQKNIIRRCCRFPFFWTILDEGEFHLTACNWITGTIRVIGK